jgi:DNA-binding response OmpR family regulator
MANILVMDNEQDILDSVKTILEKEGYNVTCVSTGQSAIDAVKTEKFDLVILDIMMPDLSGWDVFGRIRKIDPTQKIIFLSVLEISPERKEELERYGLAEYISKPFDRSAFVNSVKSITMRDDKSLYV